MSTNKANQQLDSRLIKQVADMRKELDALKTRQLLGGDNLAVSKIYFMTWNQTLVPGQIHQLILTFDSSDRFYPYISEFGITPYINNDGDFNYFWPGGPNLVDEEVKFHWTVTYSPEESNEAVDGSKTYVIDMRNPSASETYTAYMHIWLLYSARPVTGV